jgi:4-hydroxy-L-threonine phosphate dehydrogenase PdxA
MKQIKRIAITTGDSNGIGLEVTAKALRKIKPQKGTQFFLWRAPNASPSELGLIDRSFHRITVSDWPSALNAPCDYYKNIIDIKSSLPPGLWVEQMAKCGVSGSIDGLVTAPLSKLELARSGLKDKGHTDILKRVCKVNDVFMTFIGNHFNVVLITDHISLRKAYNQLKRDKIIRCAQLIHSLKDSFPKKIAQKPIGLIGCNPHAGESGVIDNKELEEYLPAIKEVRSQNIDIEGPLVPDVCFQKKSWNKYSFYMASYHDQGLIPFKMIHGSQRGIQLSLGLPFLRTSVDHGTAKDIYGKFKADSSSMEKAIQIVLKKLNNKLISW